MKQTSAPQARSPRAQFREVAAAFALIGVASVLLHMLGGAIPFIGGNLTFFIAVLFLLVPGWFLRRTKERDLDYGLDFSDGWRGARLGLLITALTFALFAPAHHVWSTKVEQRAFHFDWGNYLRPGERFFGTPQGPANEKVEVWTFGPQVHLRWLPSARPWSLEVATSDGSATLAGSPAELAAGDLSERIVSSGEGVRPVRMSVHSVGAVELIVRASEGGVPLDEGRLRTASGRVLDNQDGGGRVPLGLTWLLSLVLTQALLIALPEEFFYRGYMQRRIAQAMPDKRWNLGPLWLTWPIVITSSIFALGHLFIGFGAHRLLVFFPSLLFGALREKTGGIVAASVYHAGCNLMVYAVSAHYF